MVRAKKTELSKWMAKPNPSIYLTGDYVVVDLETTTEEKGSALVLTNKLVLACWYTSWDDKWHSKFGEEFEQSELISDIARADFIVAHNCKFELSWLDRCGVDLHDVLCFDTMLAEWVIHGNRKVPLNLGDTLKRRGLKGKEDVVGGMIKLGISPSSIPKFLLKEYCYEDVRGSLELFLVQREELEQRKQLHLIYSRCLLTPVLSSIEKEGIHLDKDAVEEEYERVCKEHAEAKQELEKFGTINWNSGKQKAELLYDKLGFQEVKDRKGNPIRTDGGARSTSDGTLSQLRASNKEQRSFLDALRKIADLQARLSKSLSFFREICHTHNCVFHGNLNQGTVGTHRLSSSGRTITDKDGNDFRAQLQNMPREYKRLITAREPGWKVVDADGSQIEFRVAGDLGHDKQAYKDIASKEDVHAFTAKTLTEAGQETDRQGAKEFTFKPLFGGGRGTPAVEAYCKSFQAKYNGVFETQTEWTQRVLRDKELRTSYGMIFYFPDTTLTKNGYITNTTSIFNYPIQGFATGEIVPIVLLALWHRLRDWQVKIVLTVHDSIIMEVGPDVDIEALKEIIARAFTEDVYEYLESCYNYKFVVPLGCGIKVGDRWGSGTEFKAEMFNKDRELIWL